MHEIISKIKQDRRYSASMIATLITGIIAYGYAMVSLVTNKDAMGIIIRVD